jgi:Fe-S-cluster containining protein
MFQIVKMQPGDCTSELAKMGMRIRCKDGEYHMEQPCPALKELKCAIYEKRPIRCRLFHCQQLRLLETDQATEADATALIKETRAQAKHVRELIEQCGLREDGQPLLQRFDRLMSTPVDEKLEPELAAMREDLDNAMRELRHVINREFRPPPGLR